MVYSRVCFRPAFMHIGVFFFCLILTFLLYPSSADTVCGAGRLLAYNSSNATVCVECGDEDALSAAHMFDSSCLLHAASTYCTAGDAAGTCQTCPLGTVASAVGATQLSECICAPGTYGTLVGVTPQCTICPAGFYCTGGSTSTPCPHAWYTQPVNGSSTQADCKPPVCGNGILEPGEDCDDGERFSGDGCSGFCKYEDGCKCHNGSSWVCSTSPPIFGRTTCCKSKYNPITEQHVCTCSGVNTTGLGYTIDNNCNQMDINECDSNNGGCADQAVCTNMDAVSGAGKFTCTCPTGMLGDGLSRCDPFKYQTAMVFELVGVKQNQVDVQALAAHILSQVPELASYGYEDLTLDLDNYTDSALQRPSTELGIPQFNVRRRVLSDLPYGQTLSIIIESHNAQQMQNLTESLDTNGMATLLANWFDVVVNTISDAQSQVLAADRTYGAINTILTGFKVEGIVFNMSTSEWLITVHYEPDAPFTLTSLYVTKAGNPPYSQNVDDSFFVSKHPCMASTSVCCLQDYASHYNVGDFADTITAGIGTCTAPIQASDTDALFTVSAQANNANLLGALTDLDLSYVTRLSASSLQLHINRLDLRNHVGVREAFAGGFRQEFFVGMSYYTLLPTNALATVASQTKVIVTETDAVTFASTSQQDFTFVDHLTLALFETTYIEAMITPHSMQFVRVGFVLPETVKQNAETGFVPLTSIRFAVASSTPDPFDSSAWINPCYSDDNTGLFDNASSPLVSLYTLAHHQQCALQPDFCTNPIQQTLDSGLVEFWFPIGDNIIDDSILSAAEQYSIYVYLTVSAEHPSPRKSFAKLFVEAPLKQLSVTHSCDELTAATSINDIVEVDLNIGVAASEADWANSVYQFNNLLHNTDTSDFLDTSLTVKATSAKSSLITIIVRGNDAFFNAPYATPFHVEIEDMISFHFLEHSKYTDTLALMAAGNAYRMVREPGTGYLQVALTMDAVNTCTEHTMPGDFTCAIRRNIYRRQVVEDSVTHSLATGVGTTDLTETTDWLQRHVFGVSQFSKAFADDFVSLTRAKHGINDRYNKAWFVNPQFRWVAEDGSSPQSLLSLTDKTVIVAIVALEDENFVYGSGGGLRRRRFLLEVSQDPVTNQLKQSLKPLVNSVEGEKMPLPPISNVVLNSDREISRMLALDYKKWVKTKLKLSVSTSANMDKLSLRNKIQTTIQENMQSFSKGLQNMHLVQFMMNRKMEAGVTNRRLLAAGDTLQWDGYISVMWELAQPLNSPTSNAGGVAVEVYQDWLRCALHLGNIQTDHKGAPQAECAQSTPSLEPFKGFIEGFWVETCNNYSFSVPDCTALVTTMQAAPLQTPTPVTPVEVNAETGYVVALQLYITLNDDDVHLQSFTTFDERAIAQIISNVFHITLEQVAMLDKDDVQLYPPGGSRAYSFRLRQLLLVGTHWGVLLREDYNLTGFDPNVVTMAIKTGIEQQLGYDVSISLIPQASFVIDALTGDTGGVTPVPKDPVDSDDDSDEDGDGDGTIDPTTLAVVIAASVGGVCVLILLVMLMVNNHGIQKDIISKKTDDRGAAPTVGGRLDEFEGDQDEATGRGQSSTSSTAAHYYAPVPLHEHLQRYTVPTHGNALQYQPSYTGARVYR